MCMCFHAQARAFKGEKILFNLNLDQALKLNTTSVVVLQMIPFFHNLGN